MTIRSEQAQPAYEIKISARWLPFADAASSTLPMHRLLRLALFQVSAGAAIVLLNGTLNRIMVIELSVPVWLVSSMVALPMLFAPVRALIGHRSDQHRSFLGWRRVPYIWAGTLAQFGGFAIMPFALLLLAGEATNGPAWIGYIAAALAFILVGAGMHTAQTAGLALATDLASDENRPKVVALLYIMLLIGMIISSVVFAVLLSDFSQLRLIKVVQGTAVATLVLNVIALWQQEVRQPDKTRHDLPRVSFSDAWSKLRSEPNSLRLLTVVGLGSLGFSMQDILLEPYGADVLDMSVSATTSLTALFSIGMLGAFAYSSHQLARGADPIRLSAAGLMLGLFAFASVILAAPMQSDILFRIGTLSIGLGGGLFAVGTLIYVMDMAKRHEAGLVVGAWSAVQATATGLAIFFGGALRDVVSGLAENGSLGVVLNQASTGYTTVYNLEAVILLISLMIIGPLTQRGQRQGAEDQTIHFDQFPG